MLTFVKNDTGKYTYGYGLGIYDDHYNQHTLYGHTGGGIGAACELEYLPDKNVFFFLAINMGTSIGSPILDGVDNLRKCLMC